MALPRMDHSSDSEPELRWPDDETIQKYHVFHSQPVDVPDEVINRLQQEWENQQ